ncbi:hypothetical protein, partial [Ornithobacterium rhinotracheale]
RQTAAFALDFFVLLGQAKRTRKKTLALYKIPKNFSFISITAVKLFYFQQKSLTMALGEYHSKAKT